MTTMENGMVNTIVDATEFVISKPLEDGDYRFWIRAINAGGRWSAWSQHLDFTSDLGMKRIC